MRIYVTHCYIYVTYIINGVLMPYYFQLHIHTLCKYAKSHRTFVIKLVAHNV